MDPSPIRSLCSGLFHVKQNLIYVLNSLQRFDDSEWGIYEDKVTHNLVAGTILLAGILEGLGVLKLEKIQDLKSGHAHFWTISDLWKQYYPTLPKPSTFFRLGLEVRDFALDLGDGHFSLLDLIVPVFNGACDIALAIAAEEGLEFQGIATKLRMYPLELK